MLSKEEICHDLGTEADLKACCQHNVGCWEVLLQITRNSIQQFVTVLYQDDNAKVDGFGGHRQCKDKLQGLPAGVCSVGVSYNWQEDPPSSVDCLQFGLTRLCSLSYTAAAEVSLLHLTVLLFHRYLDGACTMFGFWVRSNYRLQLILKFAVAVNRSRESLQWLEYSRVTGESRQWASSKSCSAAVTVLQNTSTRYMEKYFQFLQSGKYQTFLFLIWPLGIHTGREVQSGIRFRSISK